MVSSGVQDLRAFGRRYGVMAVDDLPYGAQPLEVEDDDLDEDRLGDLGWEVPVAEWAPVEAVGTPLRPPARFVDGSVNGRTVAVFDVGGDLRPALVAVIGAMALELHGHDLRRWPPSLHCESAFCMFSNDIDGGALDSLQADLSAMDVSLVAPTSRDPKAPFEIMRRRTWDLAKRLMEDAEREVLERDPTTPCLLDGLLERRVSSLPNKAIPAYGMVKRQLNPLLPSELARLVHRLAPGQRTPAFVIRTEHVDLVTWYLRLSDPGMLVPTAGIVRVSATLDYMSSGFASHTARSAEISSVSAWLRVLRCRQTSYSRAAVSIEPIVRVEGQLHAALPQLGLLVARIHRAFGA